MTDRDASTRLAVFDCDGTLVDSQTGIIAAMHAACDAESQPRPSAEAVRRMVGLPLRDAFDRLMPWLDADVHARLCDHYREAFADLRRRGRTSEPLYPGIADALASFAERGWLLGVATGKARRGLLATLGAHGLAERFATLQTADLARGKPAPDMLLKAMAETGAAAMRTVMIGDTTFDMEMARSAGTRRLGVGWGYHHADELKAVGAEVVVEAAQDLVGAAHALLEGKP